MFDNLKTDASIEAEKDVLGGFGILDTDAYQFAIDMAYIDTADSGAMSLNLSLKTQDGATLRQTLWMTSGKAKGCKNYYVTQNGDKRYLPGFNQANAICLLTVGKEISDVGAEEKVIKLYDYEQKKEVPQTKQVLVELLGKEVTIGVIRQVVDKTAKADDGSYKPTGETREENEIDKIFRTSDHMTVNEIKAEETEAHFYDKWVDKNKGVTRNRAKGAKPGAGKAAETASPAKSLFG